MILYEITKFELKYRKTRPVTFIYFGLFFLISFLAIGFIPTQITSVSGQVNENAPMVITILMLQISSIFTLITSAIMGVPVLRDVDRDTASLIFTNPIRKTDYLMGRFSGSFLVLIFISLSVPLGLMFGELMPWKNPEDLIPFSIQNYALPYLTLFIPNLIITGVLFFIAGSFSKKIMVVYLQGILFLVLYLIAKQFIENLDNRSLGAIIDPFGIAAYKVQSEYWSIAEQNMNSISMSGDLLINRILWVGISLLGLLFSCIVFRRRVVRDPIRKKRSMLVQSEVEITGTILPKVNIHHYLFDPLIKVLKLGIFYAKNMFREIPFLVIIFSGFIFLVIQSINMDQRYGTTVYPTTYSMLELLNHFSLFFFIIVIFYSGELIWKERNIKLDQIHDSLPISDFTLLFGKFLGILFSFLILLFVLIILCVIIQLIKGYNHFELGLYFGTLYSETLSTIVLYTLLAFFIQVAVNHKFLGYTLVIIFFIAVNFIASLGWEHSLIRFAENTLGVYSDMNKYGHFVQPFIWRNIYWLGLMSAIYAVTILLSIRGTDTHLRMRLKMSKYRISRAILIFTFAAISIFFFSGCYVYYNTNILNDYFDSGDLKEFRAEYEKKLKQFQFLLQPKITDVTLTMVELFPEKRDFTAEGIYYLRNSASQSIREIHIQLAPEQQLNNEYVVFEGGAKVNTDYEEFGYLIYTLNDPLEPQESIKMSFKMVYNSKGFVDAHSDTRIVYNGTFLNNSYFPHIGYNADYELIVDKERKKFDLAPKDRMMDRDDPKGITMSAFGGRSGRINFEITIGTSKNQVAIAPGYLVKEWNANNRNYFHYKMDKPIFNFYSIISAKYERIIDNWNDVHLEIYYHKGHEFNLNSMMNAMKKSLDYYTTWFGPYPYRQLRIMEFPRYSEFAQSFANTIPFSEGIGFIMDVEEDDVDFPFYVTAHEVAHQWWGHQVCEANVKGAGMLGESIAQYSALMVMKQSYTKEIMQQFLRFEMDEYLLGRTREDMKEMPISECENQDYIHYRKGSVLMYALQDYISEDSVNAALRKYFNDWAYREDQYPTTIDFLSYIREVTPDSLAYILQDMFETITFFENQAEKALISKISENKYRINLSISAEKYKADTLGNEFPIAINDWIDIGVFVKAEGRVDSLIYLKKHKINRTHQEFMIEVNQEPSKIGIDPLNKLIDKHPEDNVISLH